MLAALNAAFSRTRTSGGSRPVRRSPTKLSGAQIAALSAAFGGGSGFGGTSQDYLNSAQAKLAQSIANINNSNAPLGSKMSATGQAVGMDGNPKSFLDRVLDVVNKPLAVTTAGVARIADPRRNFLKDIRANVTPAEIFATQDWYKGLPMPAQLTVGLGSAIALDPLTYLAPSAKLAKLGNAGGLARKADEAAILAKAAGQSKEAKKLGDIAGRLVTKRGGGIGGLTNDELSFLGKQIGEGPLKGGLYFNVPGTGVIAQRVGLAKEVKQIPLGRYDWMRSISSGASKGVGSVKTSRIMSEIGDKYKGGEGELKRKILNSKTSREARNNMRVLDSARVRNGAEAIYGLNRAKAVDEIRRIATENGIDPVTMSKATGGNPAAIAEIDAIVPGFSDQLIAHEAAWRPASQQVGGSQLEALGIQPDEMGLIYQNDVDFHQTSRLTDEALEAGVGSAKGNRGRVRGPQLPRRITYGQQFLGETLRHPTSWTQRIVRRNSKGEVTEVLGVGVGRGKQGLLEAQQDAKFVLSPDGTQVRYQTFDKKGRPVYETALVDELEFETIPPSKGGLGVREQANALNNQKYGYDLFEMDYFKGQEKAMSEYTNLHGQEVQAAYLRRYTKTKLKDFPKGPKEARAAIAAATARLEDAVSGVKDARIRSLVAQSEGFVNIAEADARLQAAIDNLNKVMSSTPKDSPRLVQLRNELAAVQAERAGLHARINKAAELIESKTASSAEIEAELTKLLNPGAGGKTVPTGTAGSVPTGAVEPTATTGAGIDPNSKEEVYRRLLETTNKEKQSALRDKQFEYDSIRVEPGAPKADIAKAKKELAQAQKEADATAQALAGYNKKIPPQAVAAPVVPETAELPAMGQGGRVTSEPPMSPQQVIDEGKVQDTHPTYTAYAVSPETAALIEQKRVMLDEYNRLRDPLDKATLDVQGAENYDAVAAERGFGDLNEQVKKATEDLAILESRIQHGLAGMPIPPEGAAAAVPETATGVPIADVGTTTDGLKPLDSLKSGDKPTLVGPLDRFTDVMYRETSPDRALNMIPDASGIRGDLPDMFAANSPEYALGQGANKGAMVEMDTAGLTGKVSSKKPGWKQMYQDGYAEFSIQFNNSDAIQSSIRSITLDQTVLAKDKLLTRQWKNARTRLKSKGWTEEVLADGKIKLSRPDISGSAQIEAKPISAAAVPTPTAAIGEPTVGVIDPEIQVRIDGYQNSLDQVQAMRDRIAGGEKITTKQISEMIQTNPGYFSMSGTGSKMMPKGVQKQLDFLEKNIAARINQELESAAKSTGTAAENIKAKAATMAVEPTAIPEPTTVPTVEPAIGTVPLAPAEEFRSIFGYPRDEAVAAVEQRNTLQKSIQDANDAIDAERAALATKASQSPKVQGEGRAVETAKREVGFAVRELQAAQKAGKSEKWIGTLNKRLDKARQSLREAEAIRKLEVEQLIAKGSQDNKKIKDLLKQIAKDEESLVKLKSEAPYAFPGFDDNYARPPRMEYQSAPNVTRESSLAALTPAQRKEMLRVEQVYNVPADKMPEVIARRQAYDAAAKNHADLIAANAPDEVVAAAEWQMRGAQRDMRVVDEAMLQRSVQQAETVAAARRAAAETELGIDTTNRIREAVPPEGGYSPEWESSTLQFADDSRQARAAIDDTLTTRISDVRKELKSAKRAAKTGTTSRTARREVAVIEDELLGLQMAQDLSSRVTVEADAAVLSAIAEKAAYEEYLIELAKLEAKNATLPTGFKITLGQASKEPLANKVLTAGRKYEQAQIQTVLTAQDSAQAAKAASFASTTTNLSSDQVARLGAAVSEGTVDDTIKQIVREFALEPEQKRVVQKATKQVGNDPQAVTAIHAVAGDPKQTEKVVKASKAKKSAAAAMGGEPGSAASSANVPKITAKARKRIEELRSELDKQVRSTKRMTASQAKRYDELKEIDTRLAGYSKKIDQLEKRKRDLYASRKATAWAELEQADRIAAGELERAQRAIEMAAVGEAKALDSYGLALDDAEWTKWFHGSEAEEAVRYVVRKGYQEISMTSQAPNDIAEALALVTRVTAPNELPSFLKYFDRFTRIFKSWAVATPGFIARNGYSGVFMNYLFGVSPGSTQNFLRADRAFNRSIASGKSVAEALAELPDDIRDSYALVHNSGVLELGGQVENALSDLKALTRDGKRDVLTRIADTPLNRATYKVNAGMERYLRGAAAMDAASKGRGIEGIYDLVFKAHFDYSDLNNFENSVMKRISPFYTWFRKNLPTQMEMIFRNPKAFARFAQAKDAIEATSNPEDLVPSWMTDRLNIRLPFSIPGGQMYLLPDMPIKDLNVLGNWNDALGMINPVLKTPVELTMDTKLYFGQSAPFVGLVQLPSYMEATGLGAAAESLGFAQRSADGKLMMQDKYLYALEQFMPFLGRSRRLLPNEPKYQDRLPVTVLNTLFGLSLRANTTGDQQGEVSFRQRKVDQLATDLQKLGYGGYDYWQKQVAMASKPAATDKRPYLTLLQPKGGLPSSSPYTNVSSTGNDLAKAFAQYFAQNGSTQ